MEVAIVLCLQPVASLALRHAAQLLRLKHGPNHGRSSTSIAKTFSSQVDRDSQITRKSQTSFLCSYHGRQRSASRNSVHANKFVTTLQSLTCSDLAVTDAAALPAPHQVQEDDRLPASSSDTYRLPSIRKSAAFYDSDSAHAQTAHESPALDPFPPSSQSVDPPSQAFDPSNVPQKDHHYDTEPVKFVSSQERSSYNPIAPMPVRTLLLLFTWPDNLLGSHRRHAKCDYHFNAAQSRRRIQLAQQDPDRSWVQSRP